MAKEKDLINSLSAVKQHLKNTQEDLDKAQKSLNEANDFLEQVLKNLVRDAESEG